MRPCPVLCLLRPSADGGNFMNGEAHGGVTDLPWRMGLRNAYSDSTIYVHPTFLYESLWNVIGFIILNILYKKEKVRRRDSP